MQSKYKKWAEGISSALMTKLRIKPLTGETKNFAKIIYRCEQCLEDKTLFKVVNGVITILDIVTAPSLKNPSITPIFLLDDNE